MTVTLQVSKASEDMLGVLWQNVLVDSSIKVASSILPGLRINKNVMDSSITVKDKRHDLLLWLCERLVVAGELKRFEKDFPLAKEELISKTIERSMYSRETGSKAYINYATTLQI